MTLIKTNDRETRTVLDFSGDRCSKNKIRKRLRSIEIESWRQTGEKPASGNSIRFIDNEIKVGIFTIDIFIPGLTVGIQGEHKLKDFKTGLGIGIREDKRDNSHIKVYSHPLFRDQYWKSFTNFRMKHLVDVIVYLQRLDHLKAFL